MNKLLSFALLAIISISNGIIFSQIELPDDKVKATISLNQDDCSLEVAVDVDIVEGWHINSYWLPEGSFSIPTNINIEKSKNYKIQAGVIEPPPILEFDEMADEMMSYHHHKFKLKKKLTSKGKKDYLLKGTFSFQTCNDVKCLPEFEQPFELKVKACGPKLELKEEQKPVDKPEVTEESQTTDTTREGPQLDVIDDAKKEVKENQTSSQNEEESKSFWLIFIISFLSGFAALLTPCVFPMIPMTVSFFTSN